MKLITLTFIFTISVLNDSFAQTEESFLKFEKRLTKIAIDEDLESLNEILYDTIFESNDICGYPGCKRDEFFKFHFTKDTTIEDWRLLRESIANGFIKVDKDSAIVHFNEVTQVYEAPSYLRKVDVNKELQIIEKNTEIKKRPDIHSTTLMVVDSGIFPCNCCIYNQTKEDVIEDKHGNFWTKIEIQHESQSYGYVQMKNTSQKSAKTLEIGKINGKWKIIAFYGGEPC